MAFVLVLCGCEGEKITMNRFCLKNETGKELTIVNRNPSHADSVTVANNAYYQLQYIALPGFGASDIPLNDHAAVIIYKDGIGYQVDRNRKDCCLWESSYHPLWEPDENIFQNDNDLVLVYTLTEEKVLAGIQL